MEAYDAFISYSHAADGQLAPALQSTLQRYAKPWYRRRALRVFRDDTGLSANPHLWTSIVEALDGSRWFILLSSPDAARSEWVGREIAHWVEHKGPDRILPVVTDGTWAWDDGAGDLDRSSTAAHPALFGVFEEEPRHVDLTWARSEVQVDPRDGRFLDAVAELAAPLRGVPKDELAGEEVRQHRRTIRTAWAAAATLAVLLGVALGAGALAFVQRDEARDQRSRAEEQTVVATARSLSAQAIAQAPLRVDKSLLLGIEGVRRDRSPETVAGLLTGLNGAARLVGFHPEFEEGVAALALSEDGAVATADADGRVRLLDIGSWRTTADVRIDDLGPLRGLRAIDGGIAVIGTRGARILSLPDLSIGEEVTPAGAGPEDLATVAVAPDGQRAAVAASPGAEVELRDLASGATTARAAVPCATVAALEWAPAGDVVAATCEDLAVALIDPVTGAVVGEAGSTGGSALAFSPDGRRVAVVGADAVTVVDRATLTPVGGGIAVQRPRTALFSDDGRQVAVGGEGRVLVWDLDADRRVDELVGVEEGVLGLVDLPEDGLLVATPSTVSEWRLGQVPPLATGVGDGTDVLAVDAQGTRYGPLPDGPGLRVTAGDDRTDVDLPGAPCAVTPAPDGSAVVVSWVAPGSGTAVTELRRLPAGRVLASLSDRLGLSTCAAGGTAFAPDGRRVGAVADDGATAVWDVASGDVVVEGRTEAGTTGLGWSGDGRSLVTGGGTGRLRGWDAGSLEGSASIPLVEGSAITGVTPVAGEDRVVATVAAGQIAVVDLGDEEAVGKPFQWGGTELRSGALSPDGRLLAALGVNGNLRLWDAPSHTVLGPGLRAFPRGDSARLVFTGDDEVVTWDGVGAALRWRVDVDAWAETACDLAGRPLTRDEWDQYVPGEPYRPACDGTAA